MPRRIYIISLALLLLAAAPLLFGQDDEDESRPGLIRRDTFNQDSWESVVPDVWLRPINAQSDRFGKPLEQAHANWRGSILLKAEGRYRFHAFVLGKLRVTLGGLIVLDADTTQAAWVSGPEFPLPFGEQPLVISLQHFLRQAQPLSGPPILTGSGTRERSATVPIASGALKLFWSSDSFPLEPLPYHVLFHSEDCREIRLAQEGAQHLQAFSCIACHGSPGFAERGPSLKHVGTGTSWSALRERLMRRVADPNHGRMPNFGLSAADAEAVLVYLARYAEAVELREPPKVKVNEKETPSGGELIKSIGCLACHEWQSVGQHTVFGGGKLDDVATHRSRAWLDQWLRNPAVLNASHRMPTFKLTDPERQQILAALSTGQTFSDRYVPSQINESVQRGQTIIAGARCAACHELPGPAIPVTAVARKAADQRWPFFTLDNVQSKSGCLASQPDLAKFRPSFPLANSEAIAARLKSAEGWSPFSLLDRKNCTACHDRDGSRGLSSITLDILKTEPQWLGQTPTLVPPPLTAVGDKMQDAALEKAIQGEQALRMPWLKVRMPKFMHTDSEKIQITRELIDHDRIPPNAPATPKYPIHTAERDDGTQSVPATIEQPAEPQTLLAGRELTGGKGFSCVACHALKDYVPKQVALGTRGSDLYRLGDRLRPEFFFRWTRSPLRIIPGVEMPGYTRPHPTLLDGQLDKQLAAIWDALHDPNFTAPTNPAVVEQLWTLQPGDRPRIIRDVFTLSTPDGKTETVPRAFAVGFPNGHCVLFDLDRGAVRAWTIGDFARQRTQGKSWFWDLAGVTVAGGMGERPDVFITKRETEELSSEIKELMTPIDLLGYRVGRDSVFLDYRLNRFNYLCREVWTTYSEGGAKGWQRSITFENQQRTYPAWLERPQPIMQFGNPRFVVSEPPVLPGIRNSVRFFSDKKEDQEARRATLVVRYLTETQPAVLASPPQPPLSVVGEELSCAPGFKAIRLPLPRSIMPTAITWDSKGRLAFTSLKGHVFVAKDTDGDGLEDQLTTFAEGLAAPFGILAEEETQGRLSLGFLVAHKPEVLSLRDSDGDDRADTAKVVATGWGYTDDYHDWTTGIARDDVGKWFYIGLGSDYAHKNRPANESKWRGRILRFDLTGNVESVASELRYPVGLAMTDDDRLFCTDQQGVQNCFNELNYIQMGHRYGVPAKNDPQTEAPADVAAVQVPHPWTRSVNGIAFWPRRTGHPYAGQIVGAEFNQRALVRYSLQEVDGQMQGAVYPLSKFTEDTGPETFLGPISVAFHKGDLYVGSLYDSGWLGGLNVGDIVRLTPEPETLPNGIREVRAIAGGFAIEFLRPVDRAKAEAPPAYKLSGYTRVWGGEYATPDSGRHTADVQAAKLSTDGRTVELSVSGLKPGHVYDVSVGDIAATALWPNLAHYTLTRLPR